jgi:hypothetical protein
MILKMQSPGNIYKEFPVGSSACPRHPSSAYCTLIRLVSVDPGAPTDPLKCTLSQDCVPWGYPFQSPGGQQTKYEALSYVWGDASVTSPILLNSSPFEVTLNLKAAFEHLRLESTSRTFWIDAICINQADVKERTQQVQAMTMIYETAQRVIVWLGESRDGSDKAFEHLEKKALEMQPPASHGQHEDDQHDTEEIDPHVSIETWISPQEVALLNRPWWTRVWVVQEVAVARNVLVQCGKSTISWDTLRQAYAGPPSMSSLYNTQSEQKLPNVFQKLDIIRGLRGRGVPIRLLDLMAGYRHCQATDSRDKIFALMGLTSPNFVGESDEHLAPDYAMPCREMYMRTVRFLISGTGNLDILSSCGPLVDETDSSNLMLDLIFKEYVSLTLELDNLPSWVPDWSQSLPARPLHLCNSASAQINGQTSTADDSPIYRASGDTRPSVQPSADAETLILKGMLFDKIKECSNRPGHLFHDNGHRDPKYDWVRLVKNSKCCRYKSEKDRSRAFLRTLVADFVHGKRATEKYVQALDDWVLLGHGHLGVEDLGERIKLSAYLVEAVSAAWNGRRIFISEMGYMGLAPMTARPGDAVCILFGGHVPFILRERENSEHAMIGECYVHGIMDGEAMGNTKNITEFSLR